MDDSRDTILIMEDNLDDAFLLERALRRAGLAHPVRVLADGEEAVAYLAGEGEFADRARHPLPALVLLDLRLPKRSGLEVLEWLRGHEALREVHVVVMTSVDEPAGISRAYHLGATTCLVKPVGLDQLVGMMRTVADNWLGHGAASERRSRERTGPVTAAI